MRLNVKILGGLECEVEAGPLDTVDHLKAEVESKLRLAKADQKLLFRGKPLQDGISLSEYKLTDGSKINLVVKREASSAPQPSAGSTKQQTPPKLADEPQVLVEEELFKVLRKHFKSDNDTKKVVKAFKQIFQERLSNLSLNDWERIGKHFSATQTLKF